MINYRAFEDYIEIIFADKELEKAPTKTFSEFRVPTILQPLETTLTEAEENVLEACME